MKTNTLFSYSIIGIILMIAGQLCFAINDTIVKFEVKNIENNYAIFNVIFIRGLFATFFMTIYLLFIDKTSPNIPNLLLNINILLLGILCTAIATIIYFQILQTSGASFLSIMNFLIPLWAILFGIVILNDVFSWNYIFGLVIILLGIKLANSAR